MMKCKNTLKKKKLINASLEMIDALNQESWERRTRASQDSELNKSKN